MRITQKSPWHKAELTWDIEGLRPYCWTEGHIHYIGDRHESVLEVWPELENVHLNYRQEVHGTNDMDVIKSLHRHTGDITLLKGDKDGKAKVTRVDQ